MKKIAIIKEYYVRDAQVLSVSLEFAAENLAFDDNFIDVKYPSLYLGEFEGIDENEIRTKAAKTQGVHPDIITLITSEQKNSCAACRRQPMKPKTDNLDEQDVISCPACGYGLAAADDDYNIPPKFCSDCGQKLDWGTDSDIENISEFERLRCHVGHNIEIAIYGGDCNVSIECIDCYEVLYSADNPKIEKEDVD